MLDGMSEMGRTGPDIEAALPPLTPGRGSNRWNWPDRMLSFS